MTISQGEGAVAGRTTLVHPSPLIYCRKICIRAVTSTALIHRHLLDHSHGRALSKQWGIDLRANTSVMRRITAFVTLCVVLLPCAPLRAQANAGPDQEMLCDSTSMQANAPLPTDSAFWSLLSGSATIVDPMDPTTSVTDIAMGQNVLFWTIISPTDTTSDAMSIYRYEWDPIMANGGPDQTVYAPPFQTTMNAVQPPFPQVCTWTVISGPGIVSSPNAPNTIVHGLGVGENVLQWTCDEGFCTPFINADQVVINVLLSNSIDVAANRGVMGMRYDHDADVLRISSELPIGELSIINAMGQGMVIGAAARGGVIDVGHLPPGSYTATARIGAEVIIQRFVICR